MAGFAFLKPSSRRFISPGASRGRPGSGHHLTVPCRCAHGSAAAGPVPWAAQELSLLSAGSLFSPVLV